MPLGRKTLIVMLLVAMAAAAGFIIHTSRQAAQARENPHTHAAKVDRAIRQAEKVLNQ
jgi:cell division protein FtsL